MTRRTGNQNHHHNNRTGSVGAGPGGSNSRPQHAKQEEGEANTLVVRKKPVGLVNLGNTCFMNSALQCLSRTPNLISRLEMLANDPILNFSGSALSYNDENLKNELQVKLVIPHDTVIRKLLHLLKQMTEGTMNGPVNPRSVQLAVSKNFGIGLQHDSHELLRTVLDKMKKEQIKAFRVALMEVFKVPINEAAKVNQTDPQKALEMKEWDRKFYHTTCVDEIFGGELLTTRTCLECNTIKNSSEEFLDISLPILVVKPNSQQNNKTVYNNRFSMWNDGATKNRTLQECFQSFIEAEVLSGNNQVDCEKCHEMKLNQVRRGVPIEQVFPQPEPSTITTRTSTTTSTPVINKNLANKSTKGSTQLQQQQQQLQPQQKPQQSRKKKKKKTRKDKIAEGLLVQENLAKEKEDSSVNESMGGEATEENEKIIGAVGEVDEDSATSETDMPELEKISDEGYAEDYKDSDDSTGATSGNEHESVNQGRSPDLDLQDEEQAHAESQVDQDETSDQDETAASETEIPLKPIVVIPKSTKSSCRRQTMISKPPHNLTIHLKRFTMSSKGFTCKIGDHVKFSEYIDIRDFVTTSFPNDDQSSQVSSSSWSFEELASMANTNKEGTEETGADPVYPGAVEGSGDNHQTSIQPLSESVIIALPPAQIALPANPPMSTTSCTADISAEDVAISSTSLTAVNASQPNDSSNPANFATATASPPGNGSDFEFLGSPMSAVTGDNNFSFHSADTQDILPESQSSPDATAPIRVRVENFTKISETQYKEPVKLNESSSDDTETENGFTLIKKPFVEPELESKGDIIAAMAAATASGSTSVSDNNDAFKNFAGDTFLIERNLSSNLDQVDIMEENEDDIVCDSHSNCNGNDNDIDDEPPPYPGSPILDENDENDFTDNERPLRDAILPEDTGCSVWGYKTKQDIVEWTFKSEEAKEFGPEPVDMFAVADHSHEELQMENLEDDLSIQVSDIENSCGDIGTSSSLYGSTKINSASISVIPLPPPLPSAPSLSPYSVPVTESVRSHIALDLNLEGNDEDNMSPPNIIPLGFSSIDEMNRTNYDSGSRSRQQDKDLSWGGSDIGAKGDVGTDAIENSKTTDSFGADLMDPNGIVYRLNGIVEHSGSLHWGHYVAYVRVNSDWFYVSDSHVMSSDISTVLSQDPYILFYERVIPSNSNNPVHNQPDQTTVIP